MLLTRIKLHVNVIDMKARPYVQSRRAEAAADTASRILDATAELFLECGDAPTLEAIAQRADVAVQTILRRFGSKEGLQAAAFTAFRQRVVDQRAEPAHPFRCPASQPGSR